MILMFYSEQDIGGYSQVAQVHTRPQGLPGGARDKVGCINMFQSFVTELRTLKITPDRDKTNYTTILTG